MKISAQNITAGNTLNLNLPFGRTEVTHVEDTKSKKVRIHGVDVTGRYYRNVFDRNRMLEVV